MARALVSALAFVSVLAGGAMWPTTAMGGGKLQQVRGEVRGGGGSSSAGAASPHGRTGGHAAPYRSGPSSYRRVTYVYPTHYAYTPGGSTMAPCCIEPSPGKYDAPRSPLPSPTVASFDAYPYAPGNDGYVKRLPKNDAKTAAQRDWYAGTAHVEGAYAGDGVWKVGGGLSLRAWRFGLDGDLGWYLEKHLSDAIYLGSANATFAVVMRAPFVWRLGGGLNAMVDGRTPGEGHREYAAGPNFTTSMDIIPKKPVILSMRFDYGSIYKAPTLTIRGTVGWIIERWELYAGYEYKRVGDVPLGGPTVGVRVWF